MGSDQLIIMPDMMRVDMHRAYSFIINGFIWIYLVTSHTDRLPIQMYLLFEDGILPIVKGTDGFLLKILSGFAKQWKGR